MKVMGVYGNGFDKIKAKSKKLKTAEELEANDEKL